MIKKFLDTHYKKTVSNYLSKNNYIIPVEYQSSYVHYGGGFDVTGILNLILKNYKKDIRILLIGVHGCRDYYYLLNENFNDIVTIDVQSQKYINIDHIGSIEDFQTENKFDIIVMCEVLEHLKFDSKALLNIRECLNDNGVLFLSIPFYNDVEKSHIRIYSDVSVSRLFQTCGYIIHERFYRPGFIWSKFLNYFIHILNILIFYIFNKHIYCFTKKLLIFLEIKFSKFKVFNYLRRFNNHYGCIFVLKKSSFLDYIKINQEMYKNK